MPRAGRARLATRRASRARSWEVLESLEHALRDGDDALVPTDDREAVRLAIRDHEQAGPGKIGLGRQFGQERVRQRSLIGRGLVGVVRREDHGRSDPHHGPDGRGDEQPDRQHRQQ